MQSIPIALILALAPVLALAALDKPLMLPGIRYILTNHFFKSRGASCGTSVAFC